MLLHTAELSLALKLFYSPLIKLIKLHLKYTCPHVLIIKFNSIFGLETLCLLEHSFYTPGKQAVDPKYMLHSLELLTTYNVHNQDKLVMHINTPV